MTNKEKIREVLSVYDTYAEYYDEDDEWNKVNFKYDGEIFCIFEEDVEKAKEIIKDLERLEEIRKTFKVEKEETINQNIYWLYIEERPILITRKIYDLLKNCLEVDKNG